MTGGLCGEVPGHLVPTWHGRSQHPQQEAEQETWMVPWVRPPSISSSLSHGTCLGSLRQ